MLFFFLGLISWFLLGFYFFIGIWYCSLIDNSEDRNKKARTSPLHSNDNCSVISTIANSSSPIPQPDIEEINPNSEVVSESQLQTHQLSSSEVSPSCMSQDEISTSKVDPQIQKNLINFSSPHSKSTESCNLKTDEIMECPTNPTNIKSKTEVIESSCEISQPEDTESSHEKSQPEVTESSDEKSQSEVTESSHEKSELSDTRKCQNSEQPNISNSVEQSNISPQNSNLEINNDSSDVLVDDHGSEMNDQEILKIDNVQSSENPEKVFVTFSTVHDVTASNCKYSESTESVAGNVNISDSGIKGQTLENTENIKHKHKYE